MNHMRLDAGDAFEFWIRSNYGSLSNFARYLHSSRFEHVSKLFTKTKPTAENIRSKLDWMKQKRKFTPADESLIENIYGIDTKEMLSSFARAKGVQVTGDNNVTNSEGVSVSVGKDPVLETENMMLKSEIRNLKGRIETLKQANEAYKAANESLKLALNAIGNR